MNQTDNTYICPMCEKEYTLGVNGTVDVAIDVCMSFATPLITPLLTYSVRRTTKKARKHEQYII